MYVKTKHLHAYDAVLSLIGIYLTKIYTCVDQKTCVHEWEWTLYSYSLHFIYVDVISIMLKEESIMLKEEVIIDKTKSL